MDQRQSIALTIALVIALTNALVKTTKKMLALVLDSASNCIWLQRWRTNKCQFFLVFIDVIGKNISCMEHLLKILKGAYYIIL